MQVALLVVRLIENDVIVNVMHGYVRMNLADNNLINEVVT